MRSETKQVLIVGAGGSYIYKFPLGDELFKKIRNKFPNHAKNYVENILHSNDYRMHRFYQIAEDFSNQLKNITGISIDKYLNLNSDFIEIGKLAIASEIISCERSFLNPVKNKIDNDWYTYLFIKLLDGLDTIDDIINYFGKNLSIITFNYDRSLENFLFQNLYEILKSQLKKEEIVRIIEKIPFIHVYGKSGYLEWESKKDENSMVPFNNSENYVYELAMKVSKMIEIIYEQRKEKEEIRIAKELITNSNRLLFLGFGYDTLNLKILGFPEILNNQKVFGTAYNNTENERIHIKNLFLTDANQTNNIHIQDCDCLRLLRDHLIV